MRWRVDRLFVQVRNQPYDSSYDPVLFPGAAAKRVSKIVGAIGFWREIAAAIRNSFEEKLKVETM